MPISHPLPPRVELEEPAMRTPGSITLRWATAAGKRVAVGAIRLNDKAEGERWEYFAFHPQANVLAIGGVDAEKRGFVDVWDLSGDSADPAAKPGLDPIPTGEKTPGEVQAGQSPSNGDRMAIVSQSHLLTCL